LRHKKGTILRKPAPLMHLIKPLCSTNLLSMEQKIQNRLDRLDRSKRRPVQRPVHIFNSKKHGTTPTSTGIYTRVDRWTGLLRFFYLNLIDCLTIPQKKGQNTCPTCPQSLIVNGSKAFRWTCWWTGRFETCPKPIVSTCYYWRSTTKTRPVHLLRQRVRAHHPCVIELSKYM